MPLIHSNSAKCPSMVPTRRMKKFCLPMAGLPDKIFFRLTSQAKRIVAWPEKDMVFDSGGAVFNLNGSDIITLKGANSFTAFDASVKVL